MTKVLSYFPIHCTDEAVSHIFYSLSRGQTKAGLPTTMVVPSASKTCRGSDLLEAAPRLLKGLYYKIGNIQSISEQYFFQKLKPFDAAYLWPGFSWNLLKRVRALDKPLFTERINCFTGEAKLILEDAYARLGIESQSSISPLMVHEESELKNLVDYLVCPSPLVKNSFQEAGFPESKLILSSYGWSPQRFPNLPVQRELRDSVTILFVGYVCVRKGAHLLMQAFAKAGIKGQLVLHGRMEPAIADVCKDLLGRPDIIHSPYQRDLKAAYREADIFAFPTLEEGSPLVSYEAMAHSLPSVVSPMGAGNVIRDGIEGIVIPPYDEDAWVESLRRLASSSELRIQFGKAAYERATEFTWDKVAAKRSAMMQSLIPNQAASLRHRV